MFFTWSRFASHVNKIAKHGFDLTACALDTAGLTQTCTEWDWLIINTVCAQTSNPLVTSSINTLFWAFHVASPTPPKKIWLNTFAIVPFKFKPYRIVLPPVSCVYTTEEKIAKKASCVCTPFVSHGRRQCFRSVKVFIAYKNAYRNMCYILRNVGVRPHQVNHYVRTFEALFRKYLYGFVGWGESSTNSFIRSLQRSDAFYKSSFIHHYLTLLCDGGQLQ